jgi:hypothetical protein
LNDDIKKLKAQVSALKSLMKESSSSKLEQNVEELNEQITKMVSININLQSKMTELLIKVTDLIRENRELISLLEEASEVAEEEAGPDWSGMIAELKNITSNTADLKSENTKLVDYIKRFYTKGLLTRAVTGGKMEEGAEVPVPEESESIGGL